MLESDSASVLPSMDIDLSDLALNSMEHISSLELALCSNFSCCNIQLPDLHALVEHFEDQHVVVFSLDGMRICPENTAKRLAFFPPPPLRPHSPPDSCDSSAVSSPQTPTTPLFAPASSLAYTPFSFSAMPDSEYAIDLEFSPEPYPILTHDGFIPHHKPSIPNSRSHDPDLDASISVPTTFGDDLQSVTTPITSHDSAKREKKPRNKADIVNATAVSAKNPAKAKTRITGGNPKRREKAYRCPTPRCTKSYLNPNGLKYHLEKGTCRFEDSTDSEASTEHTPTKALNTPLTNPETPNPTGGNNFSHQLQLPPPRRVIITDVNKMTGVNSIPTPPASPNSQFSSTIAYRVLPTLTSTTTATTPTYSATSTSSC